MEVVAYLHNADLLLEDEQGVAVISGSHYVLSLGDQVFSKTLSMNKQNYIKSKFLLLVLIMSCCMRMRFR